MDKRSILFVVILSVGFLCVNWFLEPKKPTPNASVKQSEAFFAPDIAPSFAGAEEEVFVLENGFQQVVFSPIGGAISEINLPFHSQTDTNSPVLPIEFDKTMAAQYPFNDRFPSRPFQIIRDGGKQRIDQGSIGGYYPLLRRSVIGKSGKIVHPMSSRYYACNVIAEDGSLSDKRYTLQRFEKNLIEFVYADSVRKITKTFTLSSEKAPYCIEVQIAAEGDTRGLWLTTGVPDAELVSGNYSPVLKYLTDRGEKFKVESVSLPKASSGYPSALPVWLSNCNGFFGLITQPLFEGATGFKADLVAGDLAPTRLSIIDSEYDVYPLNKYPGYEFRLPLRMNSGSSLAFRFFAGPYQDELLKQIDSDLAKTGNNPYFSSAMSFQGWFTFISEPFAKFLFLLMKLFHQITGSWGFSIILLTVALRLMLYPLNGWSIKSSLKMQEISPKVAALQEKYKKEPKRAQMEIMALYKEKGVNPFTGCLPILIQIPFLIGMFDLLKSVFELRGASFIPGWIDNLTAPDVLFSWNYPIFFFGTDFHFLPFLLAFVMYLQQRLSSQTSKDPKLMSDTQKQQKMMGNIMVIVFTFIFYNFPSGLNIYWVSSTGLGILQQWFMNGRRGKSLVKRS